MELEIFTKNGEPTGRSISVSDAIFASDIHEHAIYLAVKVQQINQRQGNAKTKTRSMVSGGGKKPWKQKGRGTARAGSSRSPIWRGGGIIQGPQPHDYSAKLPKKVKRLARISALSAKIKDAELKVLEDFTVESAKTKDMFQVLKSFDLAEKKTLMLVPGHDSNLLIASRNIKNLQVSIATDASTFDLLNCKTLLMMESAVKKLESTLAS